MEIKKETIRQIKIMQSFVDGKEIECIELLNKKDKWDVTKKPMWQWLTFDYRIKGHVDWSKIEVDTRILVKRSDSDEWRKRYFSHCDNGKVYAFDIGNTSWSSNDGGSCYWKHAKLAK